MDNTLAEPVVHPSTGSARLFQLWATRGVRGALSSIECLTLDSDAAPSRPH
jgi:hypothetical protein